MLHLVLEIIQDHGIYTHEAIIHFTNGAITYADVQTTV